MEVPSSEKAKVSLIGRRPALRAPQYRGDVKVDWGARKRPVSGVRAYLLGNVRMWKGRGQIHGSGHLRGEPPVLAEGSLMAVKSLAMAPSEGLEI